MQALSILFNALNILDLPYVMIDKICSVSFSKYFYTFNMISLMLTKSNGTFIQEEQAAVHSLLWPC